MSMEFAQHAEHEAMIERCLVDGAIWPARRSDGVKATRIVMDEPEHLRVWFQIYDIDQVIHVGCLDVHGPHDASTWVIRLDPQECDEPFASLSDRRRRHAFELFDDPVAVGWAHLASGPNARTSY